MDEEGNYHEVDLDYEQQIHQHAVDEYEYDEELLDEQEYEQMDQNEINDLIADEGKQSNPTIETPMNLKQMLIKLKLRLIKSALMTLGVKCRVDQILVVSEDFDCMTQQNVSVFF